MITDSPKSEFVYYSRHSLSRHPRDITKMSRYPKVDINVDNGMLTNSVCV